MKLWEMIKYSMAVGFVCEGVRRVRPELSKAEIKALAIEEVEGTGVDTVLEVMRDMIRGRYR